MKISEYEHDYTFAGFTNISKKKYRILKISFALVALVSGVLLAIAIVNFVIDMVVLMVFSSGTVPDILQMQTFPTLVFWIILVVIVNIIYKSGKTEKVRIKYAENKK